MRVIMSHSGNFDKTERFLRGIEGKKWVKVLESYGQKGVDALRKATPVDTGLTANSWQFRILSGGNGIEWYNTNENKGVNIAIILQYGHGTGTGGYVAGRDYINPAIQPIFDEIAEKVWKEVCG